MEKITRIACMFVPQLELQAMLRAQPELVGQPVVIAGSRRAAGGPILHVSEAARQAGIHAGHTIAQARARLPDTLVVLPAEPEQIEATCSTLTDIGLGFAPAIECEGALGWLDIGDLGRLFHDERAVALAIVQRARTLGLDVRVGVAASKDVARLAAWRAAQSVAEARREVLGDAATCVVAQGQEATFVAGLPVEFLQPSPVVADALARWGIRRCEELCALPLTEVALRLGEEGARLHRLASGHGDALLQPRPPGELVEEGVALDDPLLDLEALAFVLRGLLDRLLGRLAMRQQGCAALMLRLELEDRSQDVRELVLGAPTRETAILVELARLHVARRPPSAPVIGVKVCAHAARTSRAQLDLFLPAHPAPDRLAQTVARLEALVGPGRVGTPQPVDTHRDEAIAVTPYRPPVPAPRSPAATHQTRNISGDAIAGAGSAVPPRLALRRFRPAPEVEVLVDGRCAPRALSGAGLSAQVVVAAGPYRVQGEWWLGSGGFARDCWDVHASDGTLYRLYRDRGGHWFVDGYYD